jgi:hypothetical protein
VKPTIRPRRTRAALALLLLLAASAVPRLPVLANAARDWSSDEAVDALVVQHLVHGELTLFNWDATYYGVVEGVLGLPINLALGWTPLAFKLAAFAGFLLLVAGVYLLGRRLHGAPAGLAAAALLVGFSPALVGWSTLAAGGYCLVVAWGTLTLWYLAGVEPEPTAARAFGLGLMAGFGLYIYELYLVYVALLALWALPRSFAWRALLARSSQARRAALAAAPGQLRAAALFAAGLALGWIPKLGLLAAGRQGAKQPAYALAGAGRIAANARLLVHSCIPAFFGANLGLDPELARLVAPYGRRFALAGALLLLAWGAIWLWGLARAGRGIAAAFSRDPRPLSVDGLLPLFVPLVALAFVASGNPQDAGSNRYLLPWLSALPVLGGAALARLAERAARGRLGSPAAASAAAGLGLAALLAGFPLVQIARWHAYHGRLAVDWHGLHIRSAHEPLYDVVAFLERQGIDAAYAPYWTAYKATMLAGERVIVAPFMDWDRYPPYRRAADRARRVAYLFPAREAAFNPNQWRDAVRIRRAFEDRLASAGESATETLVGPYAVVRGPGDRHLLAPAWAAPAPLAVLRAAIAFADAAAVPRTAAPGERLALAIRLVNASGAPWSAAGLPRRAGELRTAAACRWLDAAGHALPDEPERSLLPRDVAPGEALAMTVRTTAPRQPGSYRLYVTLVQEGVGWFDLATGSASPPQPIAVRERG